MTRPWASPGFGWVLAVLALVVIVLAFVGVPVGTQAIWWVVALLALAILL